MKKTFCTLAFCTTLLASHVAKATLVNVNDVTGNAALVTAFNLDRYFDKSYDVTIGRPLDNISTSFFHATAYATTGISGRDWYSFSTSQNNVRAYFDIDRGMPDLNSWITLYNATGQKIASNDNSYIVDPGSNHRNDSFMTRVLTTPGRYYLSVAQVNDAPLNAGQDYILHISLSDHQLPRNVPTPDNIWTFLVGLLGWRTCASRKKPASYWHSLPVAR